MRSNTKVMTVIGTRPEAIKLAPVVHQLAAREGFASHVCLTGQHRDMVHPILELCDIEVDYDLELGRRSQTLTDVTVSVLSALAPLLEEERPDWLLVQGDTTTAMAASLAAFYAGIPVGHVEAGLRTHDLYSPFPEELNRRVAGVVSTLHFAPTDWAAGNLRREGVDPDTIYVTGNTVIDCFHHVANLPYSPDHDPLVGIPFEGKRIVVATCHRRENLGRPIEEVCLALRTLVEAHDDVHIVFPVHPNPRVQQPVSYFLGDVPGVTLLAPLDYQPLVRLLQRCHMLVTDSGGLQEEATGVGKPVLVLRETTERPEGIEAGSARLVGADRARLEQEAGRLLGDPHAYREMAHASNPYGRGEASVQIVDLLARSESRVVDVRTHAASPAAAERAAA